MRTLRTKTENDFIDFDFDISNVFKQKTENGDEYISIEAEASYENEKVSLMFAIKSEGEMEMKCHEQAEGEEEKEVLYSMPTGVLYFVSNGKESDAFIKIMASLYEVQAKHDKMHKQTPSFCVSLTSDISEIKNEVIKLKCFFNDGNFEGDDEEIYAEIYVNIDLPNKHIQIAEKDMDYRYNIIKSLTQ